MMSAADSEPPGCPEPAAVMERRVSLRISVARCFSSRMVNSFSMVAPSLRGQWSRIVRGGDARHPVANRRRTSPHEQSNLLLQFGQGCADTAERYGDVLARRSVREAQVPLTKRTEVAPGQAGDAGVVQQVVGDLLGRAVEALDVGKDIESAVWLATGDARDGVEPVDNDLPASQELLPHLLDIILRSCQGLDAGNLGERGCAGRRVGDDFGHPVDELARAGCISKT